MMPEIRRVILFFVLVLTAIVIFSMLVSNAHGQVCTTGNCPLPGFNSSGPDLSKYPPGTVYDPRSGSIYMPKQPVRSLDTGWSASTRSSLTSPPKARTMTPVATKPTTTSSPACRCPDYHKAILAKLAAIEARIIIIEKKPANDNSDILAEIRKEADKLTAISATQDRIADALAQLAQANLATNEKLDAAIVLLQNPTPGELSITVRSPNNVPASYVDTSTAWAAQRSTGLSHAVLVVSSNAAEWDRLEPQYKDALSKFPALRLVDVIAENLEISPTPQLVLYYVAEREPQVIVGDRPVASALRDLYTR